MMLKRAVLGGLVGLALTGCVKKFTTDKSGLFVPTYNKAQLLAKDSILTDYDWISWRAYDRNNDLRPDLVEVETYAGVILAPGAKPVSKNLFVDFNFDGAVDLVYVDMAYGESTTADGKYDVVVNAKFALESLLRRPVTSDEMKMKNYMKLMMEAEK